MKKQKLLLFYFGIITLIIGIILNILMFVGNAWPTYIYGLFCLIGFLQISISFFLKKMFLIWQLLWIIIPFLTMYFYFYYQKN